MTCLTPRIATPLALIRCAVLWAGVGVAGTGWATSPNVPEPLPQATPAVMGLIVKLKDKPGGVERAQRLHKLLGDLRFQPWRMRTSGRHSQHLDFGRVLSASEAQQWAQRLRARPEVEWVVPNVREPLMQVVQPNDSEFPRDALGTGQWWLHPVAGAFGSVVSDRRRGVPGIQTAWAQNLGNNAPVIAVLDTGITAHPELAGRILPGYDFISDVDNANDGGGRDADPSDPGDWVTEAETRLAAFEGCKVASSSWHGTVIAGLMAANTDNGVGVAGVQWGGRVLPVRVAGKCGAAVDDIVAGMRWAAGISIPGIPDNPTPARIVSISFGGSAACDPAYQDAINELAQRNVIVVAAAGNEHHGVSRPASCAGVVGVAALNRDGFKATYSNFGPQLAIATVGGDPTNGGAWSALADEGMLTLSNTGSQTPGTAGLAFVSGTSFSAPVVAGVLGLMLSVRPELSAAQLREGLRLSARPHVVSTKMGRCSDANPGRCLCTATTCGVGMLDAAEALRYAQSPSDYLAPRWPEVFVDSAELDAALALGPDLPPNPPPSESRGGGALGAGWLLLLAVAALRLNRRSPHPNAR